MANSKDHNPVSVHASVGMVVNDRSEILLAKRLSSQSYSGFWEFPGGKVEAGESPEQALIRELKEEVDLVVENPEPLITLSHRYTQELVLLSVFLVEQFQGPAQAVLGQELKWVGEADLEHYRLLPANQSIVAAFRAFRLEQGV